jgi:putative inorganic carbon (hco3(-)) transporter
MRRWLEVGILATLTPIFWFPWRWPLLTLAVLPIIPVLWVALWRSDRGHLRAPGATVALLLVTLATCVATIPIADWRLGLPKVLGVAIGVAVVRATSRLVVTKQEVAVAVVVLACLSLVIVAAGALTTEWTSGKFPLLDPFTRALSSYSYRLHWMGSRPSIHPNELAGALVPLLPALLAQGLTARRGGSGEEKRRAVLCVGAGVLALCMIAVTQSRSGMAGSFVALTLLGGMIVHHLCYRTRLPLVVRIGAPAALGIAVGSTILFAVGLVQQWLRPASITGARDSFLDSRLEIWERAGFLLQDFPITGVGPGQFGPALRTFMPVFSVPPEELVPHAHNIFLAYAVELGLPGAVAVALALLVYFRQCARGARSAESVVRWTAIGLACGMAGFLVYGLTDAIGPGARGGLVLWLVLGLGMATGNLAGSHDPMIDTLPGMPVGPSPIRQHYVPDTWPSRLMKYLRRPSAM